MNVEIKISKNTSSFEFSSFEQLYSESGILDYFTVIVDGIVELYIVSTAYTNLDSISDFVQFCPKTWKAFSSQWVKESFEMKNVNDLLSQYYGFNSKVFALGNSYDYTLKNLTTTDLSKADEKGTFGFCKEGKLFACWVYEEGEKKFLGKIGSGFLAQQIVNKELLDRKRSADNDGIIDLDCFGRVFNGSKLRRMFPANCYDGDVLTSYYRPVFERHKHLLVPISDKEMLSKMKKAGVDIMAVA